MEKGTKTKRLDYKIGKPYKINFDVNGYDKSGIGYCYSTTDDSNEKDLDCINFGVSMKDGSVMIVPIRKVFELELIKM